MKYTAVDVCRRNWAIDVELQVIRHNQLAFSVQVQPFYMWKLIVDLSVPLAFYNPLMCVNSDCVLVRVNIDCETDCGLVCTVWSSPIVSTDCENWLWTCLCEHWLWTILVSGVLESGRGSVRGFRRSRRSNGAWDLLLIIILRTYCGETSRNDRQVSGIVCLSVHLVTRVSLYRVSSLPGNHKTFSSHGKILQIGEKSKNLIGPREKVASLL